ncbi:hypothetical protein TCA2_4526 [Paenibacillus sp. TCA20]|uniref:hypothetical protein n=1 Tax=Paenibacillus sp. TCA20 TaxID=1499968 RepID=UPI0004D41590|nr:hypothetical protein [Paenibacillus sp. TCA20]GAK42034.1 hypothetical protein TCA2_4526 [Paenibacillus sp. TCA20]
MAVQVTFGLAPRKTSYFDPLTNTYLTLANPTRSLTYDETKPETMKNIVHAVLCKMPALVLYEGELPASVIENWKAKFTDVFKTNTKEVRKTLDGKLVHPDPSMAVDRADQLLAGNADLPNAKEAGEPEIVQVNAMAAAAATAEAPEEVKEEVKEEAPKTTAKRTARAAAKTQE